MDRPGNEDTADPERLTQTHLEQVNVNQPFRDLAAFFGSIRYLHLVPQLVREPDRSAGLTNDPFGGDFLEQIAKTPERTRTARLGRIQRALRAAVPQLEQIDLWRDARGAPHLRGRFRHWRAYGAWHGEEQFSDGTLRLMGLLWATLDKGGPPSSACSSAVRAPPSPPCTARTASRSCGTTLRELMEPGLLRYTACVEIPRMTRCRT